MRNSTRGRQITQTNNVTQVRILQVQDTLGFDIVAQNPRQIQHAYMIVAFIGSLFL